MKKLTDSYLVVIRKLYGYTKFLHQGEQRETIRKIAVKLVCVCDRKIKIVRTLLERRGISDRFAVEALSTRTKQAQIKDQFCS